jgi:hypothetical protein
MSEKAVDALGRSMVAVGRKIEAMDKGQRREMLRYSAAVHRALVELRTLSHLVDKAAEDGEARKGQGK